MREIITIKEKMRTVDVPTGEHYEEIKYETSDGEIFIELRDAAKHEADVKFKATEKMNFWFPMINNTWYKAKDEEELTFLKGYLAKSYGRRYGESRLKVGEWFTVTTKSRDIDNQIVDHFVPLSKLKQDYAKLLKLLENRSDENDSQV